MINKVRFVRFLSLDLAEHTCLVDILSHFVINFRPNVFVGKVDRKFRLS